MQNLDGVLIGIIISSGILKRKMYGKLVMVSLFVERMGWGAQ